ncbi:MAG: hypothetical protein R6W90_06210, partial [Ignavibacteriaceae bacterium]
MKNIKRTLLSAILLLLLVSNNYPQHALFQPLGDLPGGAFKSCANGVSPDGSVIVGYGTTDLGEQAFLWTETSGMISLGNLPDSGFIKSWANSVSEGGKVIAGYGDSDGSGWDSYQGFIWTDSGGMKPVGNLDGSVRSMAFSVSANGSVI